MLSRCQNNKANYNIKKSYITRQGLVSDSIQVFTIEKKDTTNLYYLNSENDTVLERYFYKNNCYYSYGYYVSKVYFYQKNNIFISEVYLIPLEDVVYDVNVIIVNKNNNDSLKVNSIKVNENIIAGREFIFDNSGQYLWLLDLYVKDNCSNYILHNTDSLSFNININL